MRDKGNLETTEPERTTPDREMVANHLTPEAGKPNKGKGGSLAPTYCEPSRALPRLRSGGPSKYLRMGDAVALVTPRVEGGLIRPLGTGEGYSALGSQSPKFLREKGNLETTTPERTTPDREKMTGGNYLCLELSPQT